MVKGLWFDLLDPGIIPTRDLFGGLNQDRLNHRPTSTGATMLLIAWGISLEITLPETNIATEKLPSR